MNIAAIDGSLKRGTIIPRSERVEVLAPFEQTAIDVCDAHREVIFLAADLRDFTDMTRIAVERPRQFLDVGMAEQNLMTIAGGLAKTGFLPITGTFAVYCTRRAFDQIVISMGTGPSRGIVMAFAPGIASSARVHHQATDDVAVMRAVPNATVLDPVDHVELAGALEASIAHTGLVYLRAMRGQVMQYMRACEPFEIGAAYQLREEGGIGLISTGIATQWAIEASELLEEAGIAHGLLHVPSIKPSPNRAILEFCRGRKTVMTIENHNIIGGLGSLVSEVLCEEGAGVRVIRRGMPDRWAENGSLPYLRGTLGLTAEQLAQEIRQVAA